MCFLQNLEDEGFKQLGDGNTYYDIGMVKYFKQTMKRTFYENN